MYDKPDIVLEIRIWAFCSANRHRTSSDITYPYFLKIGLDKSLKQYNILPEIWQTIAQNMFEQSFPTLALSHQGSGQSNTLYKCYQRPYRQGQNDTADNEIRI